jgi:hypothetical protein
MVFLYFDVFDVFFIIIVDKLLFDVVGGCVYWVMYNDLGDVIEVV